MVEENHYSTLFEHCWSWVLGTSGSCTRCWTVQRGRNGHVGDSCIVGTWPCLSPVLDLLWFLWTRSATVGPVLTDSQLCANTFVHSYSNLCVFFTSGLSTWFPRLCLTIPHLPVPTPPLCLLDGCAHLQSLPHSMARSLL